MSKVDGEVGGGGAEAAAPKWKKDTRSQSHLTQCISQMVSESQLPYKIVNLLVTITNLNNKLTIL